MNLAKPISGNASGTPYRLSPACRQHLGARQGVERQLAWRKANAPLFTPFSKTVNGDQLKAASSRSGPPRTLAQPTFQVVHFRRAEVGRFWKALKTPSRLSAAAAKAIDSEPELYLSDVCIWEICLKWQAKKIELPTTPRAWVSEQMIAWSLLRVPMDPEHLFRTAELPNLHRDPFDRLLIAQALTNSARILTPDGVIHQYPVAVLW